MARRQARLGDRSDHGGEIVSGAFRTLVNGRPVARMGDKHDCPVPGHGTTDIVSGSPDTQTEGRPNARVGDAADCGARIITGSPNTYVD